MATANCSQYIQQLARELRQQEMVSDVLKRTLAESTGMDTQQVDELVIRKTVGGPTRFRPVTREQLSLRLAEQEASMKRMAKKLRAVQAAKKDAAVQRALQPPSASGPLGSAGPGGASHRPSWAGTSLPVVPGAASHTANAAGTVSALAAEVDALRAQVAARDTVVSEQQSELSEQAAQLASLQATRDKLTRTKSKHDATAAELAALRAEVSSRDASTQGRAGARAGLQDEVELLQQRLRAAQREAEAAAAEHNHASKKAKREVADAAAQAGSFKRRMVAVQKQLDASLDTNSALKRRAVALGEAVEEHKARCAEQAASKAALQRTVDELQEQLATQKASLRDSQGASSSLQQRLTLAEAEARAAGGRADKAAQLSEQVLQLQEELSAAKKQCSDLEAAKNRVHETARRMTEAHKSARAELAALHKAQEEAGSTADSSKRRVQQLQEEAAQLKGEHQAAVVRCSAAEERAAAAEASLAAARQDTGATLQEETVTERDAARADLLAASAEIESLQRQLETAQAGAGVDTPRRAPSQRQASDAGRQPYDTREGPGAPSWKWAETGQIGALQAAYRRATRKLCACGDSMLAAAAAVQDKVASLDGQLQERFADIASQFDVDNAAVADAVSRLIAVLEGFQDFSNEQLQTAVKHAADEVEVVSKDLLHIATQADVTRSAYANWHAYSAQLDRVVQEIRLGCARYKLGDTDRTARAAVQAMAKALERHVPMPPPLLEERVQAYDNTPPDPARGDPSGGAAAS